MQTGAVFNRENFHGRDFAHLGLGYRQLDDSQFFGVNGFLITIYRVSIRVSVLVRNMAWITAHLAQMLTSHSPIGKTRRITMKE